MAGYKIIADILEVYTESIMKMKTNQATSYDKLLIKTLPSAYQNYSTTTYDILLNVSCFVASLSDSAAVHLHNKIMGRQL